MLRWAFIVSTLLTSISLVLCYSLYMAPRSDDSIRYEKLVRDSEQLAAKQKLDAQQVRKGVQKDLWIPEGEERLHFRIQSAASHLSLIQKKGKFGAVEALEGITCWIQEEIDRKEGMQQVRTLTSKEGIYTYPAHRFEAETVAIEFYRIPGDELPSCLSNKPYLTGMARDVVLGAAQKIPTFTAYHLRAKFDPGLPCSK